MGEPSFLSPPIPSLSIHLNSRDVGSVFHNWDRTLFYSLMSESTLEKNIHEHNYNFREFNVFYFSKWLNIYKIASFFPYVFYNL